MSSLTRRSLRIISFFGFLLLIFVNPAFAQNDLTRQIDLLNGYIIFVPDDWQRYLDKDTGFYFIGDDRGRLYVLNPLQVEDELILPPNYTVEDVLAEGFQWITGSRLRNTDIEALDLNGHIGLAVSQQYEEDGQSYEEWFVAIELAESEVGFFYFSTPSERMGTQAELWESIAASFGRQSDLEEATPEAVANSAGGECFVSTDSANTVQLRVGPGYNRSSVAFLPAGSSFAVLGANTADDGSEWFQLDKSEVAPNSAANELWVAREDVSEEGNCDAIGEVAAPPVVPIVNQPPPQTTGGEGGEAQSAVQPGEIPNNGRWLIMLDRMTYTSCQGTETTNFLTEVAFGVLELPADLIVSDGGTSIALGDNVLTLVAPGNYYGSLTFDNGMNSQLRLQVVSSTFMTGSLVQNATFDGLPCSATVALNMTFLR